jgi:hypothetical protein
VEKGVYSTYTLIELAFLPGRAAIEPHDENFHAVITYE